MENFAKLDNEGFLATVGFGVAFALQVINGLCSESGEIRAVDAFGKGLHGGSRASGGCGGAGIVFAETAEKSFASYEKGGEIITDAGLVALEQTLAFGDGFGGGDRASFALDGELAGDEGFEAAGGFLAELLDGDLAREGLEARFYGLLGEVGFGGGGSSIRLAGFAETAEAGGDTSHFSAAEGV